MPRKIKLDEHPEDMIEQLSPKYDVSAIEIHYAFMAEDLAIIREWEFWIEADVPPPGYTHQNLEDWKRRIEIENRELLRRSSRLLPYEVPSKRSIEISGKGGKPIQVALAPEDDDL